MYVYVSFIVLDYMYQLPYKQYKMSLMIIFNGH